MKHSLFLLLLPFLACTPKASAVGTSPQMPANAMVVEGQTWWYKSLLPALGTSRPQSTNEFGITIGPEVEIDGALWHQINLIADGHVASDNTLTVDATDICLSYIREDNSGVHVMLDFELLERTDITRDFIGTSPWSGYYTDDKRAEVKMYDAHPADTYSIGTDAEPVIWHVQSRKTITNSGLQYDQLQLVDCEDHSSNFGFGILEPTITEGIGYSGKDFGELFFFPFSMITAGTGDRIPAFLRYVTDSTGNIIYEGQSGLRLWEHTDAVGSVTVDATDGAGIWFNLQGMPVEKPSQPGVYIVRRGGTIEKRVVR